MSGSGNSSRHNLPGMFDVSTFADLLGASPLYHQREALRWNSALQVYMQMANEDRVSRSSLTKLNDENLPPPPKTLNSGKPRALFQKSISLTGEHFPTLTSIHNKNMCDKKTEIADSNSVVSSSECSALLSPTVLVSPPNAFHQTPSLDDAASASSHCASCRGSIQSDMLAGVEDLLAPTALAHDDGLSVPPVECEWRNIQSFNSLYKPDVFPFMAGLPSGRYGFMTPPVRSMCMAMAREKSPKVTSSAMMSPCESSLNSLELEAIAAVHELQFVVKDIFVSELLPRTSELIFLNVTTLEGQAYCIELTVKGWRVTSLRHDCMNGDYNRLDLHTRYFETIYSLMDNISASYRHKFHEALSAKLLLLAHEQLQQHASPKHKAASTIIDKFQRDENVRFSIEGDEE